jgi:hypothetical protein
MELAVPLELPQSTGMSLLWKLLHRNSIGIIIANLQLFQFQIGRKPK